MNRFNMKKGVKWVLVVNTAVFASQYLNSVVIGRIGPEALGFLQVFRLLVRLIPVFFLLGGELCTQN